MEDHSSSRGISLAVTAALLIVLSGASTLKPRAKSVRDDRET